MKKLELKEQPKSKKRTKAHLILNNTKKDLKDFIKLEAVLLYKAIYGKEPDFEEEGGWSICTSDLCGDLYINVKIDYSCERIILKRIEMAEIVVLLDDTVIVADEDGNKWDDNEITIEELATIADLLELTYLNKVNALD